MPSGQVARKLGISPRTLGKITGNLYAQMSDGSKEDIGLFVKHGSKGLCVPDYVQAKPEDRGWAYSQSLLQVLEQYKVSNDQVSEGRAVQCKTMEAGRRLCRQIFCHQLFCRQCLIFTMKPCHLVMMP